MNDKDNEVLNTIYVCEQEDNIYNNLKKVIIKFFLVSIIIILLIIYMYILYFRPVKINENIDKNSIHYATDLYYSDGRYYESLLNEQAKKIYLDTFNDIKNLIVERQLDCRNYGYPTFNSCTDDFIKVIDVILMEHPDFFWYRSSRYSWTDGDDVLLIKHNYVTTNKLQLFFVGKRLQRKIDSLAKDFEGLTDYDKVKSVYTWLGKTTHYSLLATNKSGTAWSALLKDDSVCAGFAAASQLLFQRMGIESLIALGDTSGPHAWNFVKLDDGYYWYDSTVAGSVKYESDNFYNGLLFKNVSNYSLDFSELSKLKFGTKYLN
ncbi:MAG: hypothetical protein IJO33_02830 [Bacilli bacterium]|nr:hypothetical protein [Bacilli bacterium]